MSGEQTDKTVPIERALVFANGDLEPGPAVRAAMAAAGDALVLAADGGARLALTCDRLPDTVIGDMDSLPTDFEQQLRARGVQIELADPHKDETDLELTLLAAAARGATWIRIIGAGGGRLDQMLANVYLLALPELADRDVRMVSGRQTTWLIGPGTHTLSGDPGDTVSLLPLAGDAENVRTQGLEYPLHGETLHFGPARGVSNILTSSTANVSLASGRLLVVHTVGRA